MSQLNNQTHETGNINMLARVKELAEGIEGLKECLHKMCAYTTQLAVDIRAHERELCYLLQGGGFGSNPLQTVAEKCAAGGDGMISHPP